MHNFYHWCFDRGWFTITGPTTVDGSDYQIEVATMLIDEFFKDEAEVLQKYDHIVLVEENLPYNRALWPNRVALDWHNANVFEG